MTLPKLLRTAGIVIGVIVLIVGGYFGITVLRFRWMMRTANDLYMQRRYEEAAAEYERASAVSSISGLPHLYRGEALLLLGRSTEARSEMAKAVEIEHEDAHSHVRLAFTLIECGDRVGAEKEVQKAL